LNNSAHAVEIRDVVKRFGTFTALHSTSLHIEEGSFVTLLGPSGCGKTTTLRIIAGLIEPSEGDILIRGRRVNDTPIHKRNLGLVFQNYALFPHKSVFDNVAFGLKYRRIPRDEVEIRVNEALELVQLPHLADRYPRQLSGGQQQRIALARAIVIRPDVLLLDEPLSALDANLREDMRVELKRIQHHLGITTIFVTHDQAEALAMSDRIVVMRDGRIEQIGAPEEVYNRPASQFVARFLGNSNILPGRVGGRDGETVRVSVEGIGELVAAADKAADIAVGDDAQLVVRAEKVHLAPAGAEAQAGTSVLPGVIETVDYQGQAARYFVSVNGHQMQAINSIDERPFREGETVSVRIRARDCVLLPAEA
jgi:putative spermidine/putrescine transport system ATP-binding protein